ncbi:MAG: 50S ribosomal protein L21e [Methanonatronarchaeales archaeon]|nr:50S ribosomal protein L21e [Methanonatronarchaeales archaeon]
MVRKSKGFKNHSRQKLKKGDRERGLTSIARAITRYSPGDMVHIDIDPGEHRGMPHPRFQGTTGEVVEERGRGYVVEVRDHGCVKTLTCRPEHLRLQGNRDAG